MNNPQEEQKIRDLISTWLRDSAGMAGKMKSQSDMQEIQIAAISPIAGTTSLSPSPRSPTASPCNF